MAKEKEKRTAQDFNRKIEEAGSSLSRTEQFIEDNRNYFIYGVVIVLLVVFGLIGYYRFIRAPKLELAWSEAYKAEFYFEKDSFRIALHGDGFYPGFLNVIDEYRRTPIGNASRYYAGVSYMRLGNYNEAVRQLKQFRSNDPMVGAMALGVIGDAKLELNEPDKAVDYYLRAERQADNEFLGPIFLMKAAKVFESKNQYDKALELYYKIEREYYGTTQQNQIEKYITRAEFLSN